jgi:hypothetical protein
MKGVQLNVTNGAARLKILGPIDETCEFPQKLDCDSLVIDFDSMTIMNSFGIRVWMTWTDRIAHLKTIVLENCRPPFIQQVRFIAKIIPPNARVQSFYVPLFDSDTGDVQEVKMVYGQDYGDTDLVVPLRKNAKGKPLELDVPDAYFSFLEKQK